ncbi:sigma-54-dependent Fis family transcriptional regulator [Cupriavidus basilensis]
MDLRQREHIDTVVQLTTRAGAPTLRAPETIIQNSWRRCVHQYGLDPARMQQACILPQTRLREHQQRIDDFARIARHGLQTLYSQVAGMGYVVLLTDAQGVTVDYLGDASADASLRHAGLYLGAQWSEAGAGTCAVGTALATGQALTVHQADHFDATHIPLTCTAAPLFDSHGSLCAILDISALTSPQAKDSQGLALQMVRIYATRIENASFVRSHREDWILKLNAAPEFVDVNPEYLLALDAGGRIVGHNRARPADAGGRAGRAARRCAVLGMPFESLFERGSMSWAASCIRAPSEQRALALARSGGRLYLSVMPPALRWQRRPRHRRADHAAAGAAGRPVRWRCGTAAAIAARRQAGRLTHQPADQRRDRQWQGISRQSLAPVQFAPPRAFRGGELRAAIPESLIENELFGHLPNSFSGAGSRPKRGLIQEADGGTLFLDEIGDMPRELQSRLLRVLAEGEVLAIGACARCRSTCA